LKVVILVWNIFVVMPFGICLCSEQNRQKFFLNKLIVYYYHVPILFLVRDLLKSLRSIIPKYFPIEEITNEDV
jgi:hypothetical protein